MADFDSDFSDELLELAGASGAPEKKRKNRHGSSKSSKRRKADVNLDSEDEGPESEENDQDITLYPLEGKYVDEADKRKLLEMSEIEREGILEQRLEEMQRFQDTRNLDQLLKAQKGGEVDTTTKASKRSNAARGLNKEKTQKLDEYKAKRLAKGDKKRKTNSPKREHSSSPMEMETESEEEEDGQITKLEEQEERERKLYGTTETTDETITMEDLMKCQVTRDQLSRHCMAPWFEDFVKGAWVRYCIGSDRGTSVYRLCEIVGLNESKNYKINDQTVNQNFMLKHGASSKDFPMDRTSNSGFDKVCPPPEVSQTLGVLNGIKREFERLVHSNEFDKVKLPTKKQLEKKAAEMTKLTSQPVTESDITAMLARKNQINSTKHSAAWLTMEKSRLNQARTLAYRRQDYAEMATIDTQLAELTASMPVPQVREDDKTDILAKVNERNRKANVEAVRKAEQMEADRKRRERKLAAAARASSSPAPSTLLAVKNGISRFVSAANAPNVLAHPFARSRPATPNVNGKPTAAGTSPLSTSALSKVKPVEISFEASIAAVEVDLGDF